MVKIDNNSDLIVSPEVEQVIIGSLLGDGCISNARLQIKHSAKQLPYLRWKYDILGGVLGGKIYRDGFSHQYKSRKLPFLNYLKQKWYPNGEKYPPKEELNKLDPLGLAIWYQDDGSYNYRHKRCVFSSSFEKSLIRWIFQQKWGWTPKFYETRGAFGPSRQVVLNTKDSNQFLHLISLHVHPCLTYKLGHLSNVNQPRLEKARIANNLVQKRWDRKHPFERSRAYRHRQLKKSWASVKTLMKNCPEDSLFSLPEERLRVLVFGDAINDY